MASHHSEPADNSDQITNPQRGEVREPAGSGTHNYYDDYDYDYDHHDHYYKHYDNYLQAHYDDNDDLFYYDHGSIFREAQSLQVERPQHERHSGCE